MTRLVPNPWHKEAGGIGMPYYKQLVLNMMMNVAVYTIHAPWELYMYIIPSGVLAPTSDALCS